MACRERSAVTIGVHSEDHGPVDLTWPQEVAVERVWRAVGLDGEPCGHQRLRCSLTAVKGDSFPSAGSVDASVQVAVQFLQLQERGEVIRIQVLRSAVQGLPLLGSVRVGS